MNAAGDHFGTVWLIVERPFQNGHLFLVVWIDHPVQSGNLTQLTYD